MSEVATLDINLTGNAERRLTAIGGRLDGVRRKASRLGVEGSAAFRALGRGIDRVGGKLRSLAATGIQRLMRLARTATLVGAAFAAWQIGAGVKLNAQLEQYNVSLGVLYRSAARAASMMKFLVEFSARTPFRFEEIAQGAVQLRAFGLEAKRWIPVAGDVAAAFGRPISEVARALGLLRSGATGEAVESFRRMGINMRELRGLEWARTGQLLTPPGQAMPIVEQYLTGRFGGMMVKQSKTYSGALSTLLDNLALIRGELTKGLFEKLREKFKQLTAAINGLADNTAWRNFKAAVDDALGGAVDYLEKLIKLFVEAHEKRGSLAAGFGAVWDEIEPKIVGLAAKVATVIGRGLIQAFGAASKERPGLTGGLLALMFGGKAVVAGAMAATAAPLVWRAGGRALSGLGRLIGTRGAALPFALQGAGMGAGYSSMLAGSGSGALGMLSGAAPAGMFKLAGAALVPLAIAAAVGALGVLGVKAWGSGAARRIQEGRGGFFTRLIGGWSAGEMERINRGATAGEEAREMYARRQETMKKRAEEFTKTLIEMAAVYAKIREDQEQITDLIGRAVDKLGQMKESFLEKFRTPEERLAARGSERDKLIQRYNELVGGFSPTGTRGEQAGQIRSHVEERLRLIQEIAAAEYRVLEIEQKRREVLEKQNAKFREQLALMRPEEIGRLAAMREQVRRDPRSFLGWSMESREFYLRNAPESEREALTGGAVGAELARRAGGMPAIPGETAAAAAARVDREAQARIAEAQALRDSIAQLANEQKSAIVEALEKLGEKWGEKAVKVDIETVDLLLRLDAKGELVQAVSEAIERAETMTVQHILDALESRMNTQALGNP